MSSHHAIGFINGIEYEGIETGELSSIHRRQGAGTRIIDESSLWSADEINKLIEAWQENVEAVNKPVNEAAMTVIAEYIDTEKTATQVRNKLKKLRARYVSERETVRRGGRSRWRFYEKLDAFSPVFNKKFSRAAVNGNPAVSRKRPFYSSPSDPLSTVYVNNPTPDRTDDSRLINILSAVTSLNKPQPVTELPPIYPYDPEVSADVEIEEDWNVWNASLDYSLSSSGIRTLKRSGFSFPSKLELLKKKGADVSMLNLNYHDYLALEHHVMKEKDSQPLQFVTDSEGTLIEVRGCTGHGQLLMMTRDGVNMLRWNKALSSPLSHEGLTCLLESGFKSPNEVSSLLRNEDLDDMNLTMRDKIALRKVIEDNS